MSKCISAHGEYSEHEGTGEFCDWCGACNHDAVRRNAKIEALQDLADNHTVRIPDILGDKVQAVFTETIWEKLDDLGGGDG